MEYLGSFCNGTLGGKGRPRHSLDAMNEPANHQKQFADVSLDLVHSGRDGALGVMLALKFGVSATNASIKKPIWKGSKRSVTGAACESTACMWNVSNF